MFKPENLRKNKPLVIEDMFKPERLIKRAGPRSLKLPDKPPKSPNPYIEIEDIEPGKRADFMISYENFKRRPKPDFTTETEEVCNKAKAYIEKYKLEKYGIQPKKPVKFYPDEKFGQL